VRGRPWFVPYFLSAKTSLCVTQLPDSEAAIQRAFSHLKIIILKGKEHMLNDLLGALMFLRTNERTSETSTLTSFWALLEEITLTEHASDYQGDFPSEGSFPEEGGFRELDRELPRRGGMLIPRS
jgi:hypothetical protein